MVRILTIHDATPLTHPECHNRLNIHSFLRPSQLLPDDFIITVSESAKSDFLRHFEHPADRIRVLSSGIDTHLFHRDPNRRKEAKPGRHYILSVGTVEPRKNLIRGLRAFESLSKRESNLEWWIAGARGWGWNQFQQELRHSPAISKIRILGVLSDTKLAEAYQQASAIFFPSLWEGFGLPLIEGFACGAPVVASDIPVFRELGGAAPSFCDPNDPEEMSDVLHHVLDDSALRSRMIAEGFERARPYAWETVAREHLKVYAEALGLGSVSELGAPSDAGVPNKLQGADDFGRTDRIGVNA